MAEISKKFTTERFDVLYEVEEAQDGLRLDQLLQQYFVSFSRQQIKKKIKAGDIKIQGRPHPHKASVKVYHREKIEMFTLRGDLENEYWRGDLVELKEPEIIYKDDDLLAISKPAYMATHPTGRHLFNCCTVFYEQMFGHTIHSVHRLDRETSGVQLLARNPKTAQKCTSMFERDEVSKCYFFMAHKKKSNTYPLTATERMGAIIGYEPQLYVHIYPNSSTEGKHAETTYVDLYEDDQYFLGLAFPRTGRQHQIRAHAAYHGLPLIGDKLYNGDNKVFGRFKDGIATEADHDLMQISRHALHAIALKMPYPNKENPIVFKTDIPQDFKDWIKSNLSQLDISKLEKDINDKIQTRLGKK